MSGTIAECIAKELLQLGYNFFSSVPCGVLRPLIGQLDTLTQSRGIPCVAAPREDVALGLCCGAYLSGKKPVAMMQNSGLGLSVNAIASLLQPFAFPLLMIISVRGHLGLDTEENLIMGAITEHLLQDLGVKTFTAGPHQAESAVHAAAMAATTGCAALLVTSDTFSLGTI